ncbi:MAG: DUF1579 family protein [Armatimonadetes bacterium]|nr:DUF1579 family protein [Armatimonadota bacterium]
MRKTLLIVSAVFAASLCMAQPNTEPSDEIKKFDWMVGEWVSSSVWNIDGMEMPVETKVLAVWDGQFLRHTTVSDFGMMEMTETMMFGYDAKNKWYFSSAYTNMAPMPRVEYGRLVGSTLVMISDPWEIMGDVSVSRATIVKVSDDEYTFTLEFKEGGSWTLINESTFKRVEK